jgi:hypothetical protein
VTKEDTMADKDLMTTLRVKGMVRKTKAVPRWTWGQPRKANAQESLKERISRGASQSKLPVEEGLDDGVGREELEECGG